MKPTQVADLFSNIKATFVPFFSILMFVALGVGVFLGISWSGPALQSAANTMHDQGLFHDFQIQFPYGLTHDDMQQLAQVEGVSHVEGGYQSFQTTHTNNRNYTVKVQSLGQSIDVGTVRDGQLPTQPNEIAISSKSAETMNVNVGDIITFAQDGNDPLSALFLTQDDASAATNASGMKYLTSSEFKVTAIMDTPEYLSKEPRSYGFAPTPSGNVHALMWVLKEAFDAAAFHDGFPLVNMRCDSLAGKGTFDDEYNQDATLIEEKIEELGNTLATTRYHDLHDRAQGKVDEGQQKLDEAEAQITEGEQQIAQGKTSLETGRTELEKQKAEGQQKLDEAYQKLVEGEALLADGERKMNEAREGIDMGRQAVAMADAVILQARMAVSQAEGYKKALDEQLSRSNINLKEYEELLDGYGSNAAEQIRALVKDYGVDVPAVNHLNFSEALTTVDALLANADNVPVTIAGNTMTLGEARAYLNTAEHDLAVAEVEYNQKMEELEDGWRQYYEGQQTLEREVTSAEQQLAEGESKLEDATSQVDQAKQQVEEGKPKLDQARAALDGMTEYSWTVSPRSRNASTAEITMLTDITKSLSISMAALFVIVGLLVSYFAVSRIVHDQITQIGTKKALGFHRGEITAGLLCYSGMAVLLGAVIGTIVGYLLVERIIGRVFSGMFVMGEYPAFFGLPLFLVMTAIELALVLGVTYLACRRILKEHAIELLRGEKPPHGQSAFLREVVRLGQAATVHSNHREQLHERPSSRAQHHCGRGRVHGAYRNGHYVEQQCDEELRPSVSKRVRV